MPSPMSRPVGRVIVPPIPRFVKGASGAVVVAERSATTLTSMDEERIGLFIDYENLGWPDGYWPETTEPPTEEAWHESVGRLLEATEAMAAIVEDHEHDLYTRVPSAEKRHHHTLRAALILLDHNGYHAGQLVDLRLALGVWAPARGA